MVMSAAFYKQLENPEQGNGNDQSRRRRGRPAKKGERLPSPEQLAADENITWEKHNISIYGRKVTFLTKTQIGLWYNVSYLVEDDCNSRSEGSFGRSVLYLH
jgi:hypothetical protein